MKEQKDILDDIEKIVSSNSVSEAILKLSGYMKKYYWNQDIRTQLGMLYLKKQDFVKAGKFLYFKKNKTELEERSVIRFKESCGNKYVEIFRRLNKLSKPPMGIEIELSKEIFILISNIIHQENGLPKDVALWVCNYERLRRIKIEEGGKKQT